MQHQGPRSAGLYTSLAEDGELDGRLEQVLQVVEGAGAQVLQRLRNPLFTPAQPEADAAAALAQFLSFQLVRGVRYRREQELIADYVAKIQVRRRPAHAGRGKRSPGKSTGDWDPTSDAELAKLRVVGHQNEYLRLLGSAAESIFPHLVSRPVCVLEVDVPELLTCDEPVLVLGDTVHHLPECALSQRERDRALRRAAKRGQDEIRETLHIYPTRPAGVAEAEEIALPLSPRRLIVLGPPGGNDTPFLHLTGADSRRMVEEVNRRIIAQAYQWVVGRPDHPELRTMELPLPGPLVAVCDGGSPLARDLERAPSPRHPERLRQGWGV